MLSRLRSAVSPFKRALALPLARAGVSPDAVTLAAVPLSVGAAALAASGQPGLALALAVPAGLADMLDGEVARLQGSATPFGNFLEAVVDRVVEGALLAGLAVRYPLAAIVALGLSMLVSYVKARAGLVVLSDNRDWPGCGGRTDRMVLILVAMGLEALGGPTEAALWLLAGLALAGCLQRVRHARRMIREGQLLPYLSNQSMPML